MSFIVPIVDGEGGVFVLKKQQNSLSSNSNKSGRNNFSLSKGNNAKMGTGMEGERNGHLPTNQELLLDLHAIVKKKELKMSKICHFDDDNALPTPIGKTNTEEREVGASLIAS
eukprot:m.56386 g.56386  ORF g.56386 m.56386 type:complete len:113 (+) comp7797_c1_seq2:1170-1508(+)